MDFTLELPLNQTGLGQVGTGVAVEIFERGLYPNIFVIGEPDFSYTNLPEGFIEWFKLCTSKALRSYKKDQKSIKLWHLHDARSRITNDATLYTVHETDKITSEEKNILKQYNRVLVTSNYTQQIFDSQGVNATVCPNFFDGRVFSKTKVQREGLEDVSIFGLFGKMEKRKRTAETVKAWVKKFGGDKKYRLHCHVFNPFLMQGYKINDPRDWLKAHKQILENQIQMEIPWNVTFYGFQQKEEYNLALNVIDIDLGLSGGEGFNLPLFHTRALGKKGVVLNAHAHREFCNEENSVLVEPNGKEDSADGMFFHKGSVFNQGNIFTFSEDAAIAAMEEALERSEPDYKLGLELQQKFSVQNCVDKLLEF